MKKTVFALLGVFILVGCVPEPLDIVIPQAETKMVIYTQALPDQALIVSISKSFSALALPNDNEVENGKDSINTRANDSINAAFVNQFLVTSALVTINGPDYNDTLINLGNGFYVAPFFPFVPGNIYRLEAYDSITGFFVSSVTTTLPILNFESISAERGKGEDSTSVKIKYKVDDIPGENYFLVNIYIDSIPQSDFFGFNSNSESSSFIFSDREYAENQIIREDDFLYERNTDTIIATLTNISRDYYNFLAARNRAGNSFLSEPITYPSNVENGYGYFNLHFPSARIVTVEN